MLQLIFDGLFTGAPYALFGLAFTIQWSSMRLVNLAFPQVAAATALMVAALSAWMPVVGATALAIVAGTALGMVTHYVGVWPVRHRISIIPIMSSLGVGLLLQGLLEVLAGRDQQPMIGIFPSGY